MVQDELRQAIQQMQDGQAEAAAALLLRLVDEPALDAKGRAAAFVWLAEARDDRAYKQRCLERALEYEPDNMQIRQGLNQLLARPDQPEHLPLPRQRSGNPTRLEQAPAVLGVAGGRNGMASGVFVHRDGLLATTSYAVGGVEAVTVRLDGERELSARVTRRYPLYDLALIETPIELARRPAVAPPATMAENTTFVAVSYGGARLRGTVRSGGRGIAGHWLGTNIAPVQLPDAGGNPMVDGRQQLLAILTRNIGQGGYACALSMTHILALAQKYKQDRQLMPEAGYCRCCGALARALLFGGGSCETCGALLPGAPVGDVQSDQLMRLYGEQAGPPCGRCGARVGQYGGRCLRCGYAQIQRSSG